MDILLINHYAGSNYHGMEYRPYYFAREWGRSGHNVTIVAASFSHLRSTNPLVSKKLSIEYFDGIKYIWLKTNKYKGNGLGRIINMLTFVYRLLYWKAKIINESNPDSVIASSTYPLDIYPAFIISHKTKSRLIFEVHDLWPLSPIELGGMSKWNPFIFVMQLAENFAYKKADRVVSLLPKTKVHMIEHGMNPDKFEYIPNGINLTDWKENFNATAEHFKVLTELKKNNKFIVGYTGAHGIANALHFLIDSANLVKHLQITFVLIGQGQEKDNLIKRATDRHINNIIFLPPVLKKYIPAILSLMDVLYIGWNKIPIYRFGVNPNKLLDYMMSAKPVIHGIDSGNDIVFESGCGISIPPENPEAIAEAIVKIQNMSETERIVMGSKGRKYVEKEHEYRILASKFIKSMTI